MERSKALIALFVFVVVIGAVSAAVDSLNSLNLPVSGGVVAVIVASLFWPGVAVATWSWWKGDCCMSYPITEPDGSTRWGRRFDRDLFFQWVLRWAAPTALFLGLAVFFVWRSSTR